MKCSSELTQSLLELGGRTPRKFITNGEIRDREQNFRGLKTRDSPILKGYQRFHNYIRPHEGLD